ncbi:MAG: hypothetical protein ACUVT5_01825 [Candidatus Bathyarchaeales archaeon]
MQNWNEILKETPVDWLLENNNPSVRYFTLKEILDKSENDSEIVAAKKAIPNSQIVSKIFAKQNPDGSWMIPHRPYLPKYKSSYWTVMTLSQLGMGKTDPRMRKACELIFQFQHSEGGFTGFTLEHATEEYEHLQKKGKKLPKPLTEMAQALVYEQQMSCLTGNVCAALIRTGYKDDPRVKKALEWLVKIQFKDGGWLCPYWKAHIRDTHSCFYGTICPLEAFSELPKQKWTKSMKQTVERSAEWVLMHRLFKADHHGYKVIKQAWLKLGFPWFWGYNILRGLDVLTKLGYTKDERLTDAVEILMQKRRKDGTWLLETAPAGRMHTNLEPKGKPSKWITLIALRTLKQLSEK